MKIIAYYKLDIFKEDETYLGKKGIITQRSIFNKRLKVITELVSRVRPPNRFILNFDEEKIELTIYNLEEEWKQVCANQKLK